MMAVTLTDQVASGDGDPIDLHLHRLGAAPVREAGPVPWHVRFGVSWSSGSPPVILLLLIGAALGPQALAVLTLPVLSSIDPALPVALAALGVNVALNLPITLSRQDRRLLAAASVEGLVTAAIVTGGTLLLLSPLTAPPSFHAWLIALAAGVCAAMSSALPSDRTADAHTPGVRARNLDALVPIIAGGLLLAWVREGSMDEAAVLLAQAVMLAIVIAVAAWLLLARTSSDTEQRILGAAALLLVGGLADYLSLSAVLSGLIAGTFWRIAGGQTRESIRRDIGYLQHPLLVLMLVVAGARMQVSFPGLLLLVAYPVLRTAGKLGGGWLARRLARDTVPVDFGSSLISPGVLGIAFAMNTVRAAGPQADSLLGMVVVGTMASQLIVALRRREEAHA